SGIGQRKSIDAAQVCGGQEKVNRVEVQQTFVNGLLSVVTFGVYTPREARVYCAI
ncbi:Bor family protein, partial [Pantoea agglomerans]